MTLDRRTTLFTALAALFAPRVALAEPFTLKFAKEVTWAPPESILPPAPEGFGWERVENFTMSFLVERHDDGRITVTRSS